MQGKYVIDLETIGNMHRGVRSPNAFGEILICFHSRSRPRCGRSREDQEAGQ